MDRGAWWAPDHGIAKCRIQLRLTLPDPAVLEWLIKPQCWWKKKKVSPKPYFKLLVSPSSLQEATGFFPFLTFTVRAW